MDNLELYVTYTAHVTEANPSDLSSHDGDTWRFVIVT